MSSVSELPGGSWTVTYSNQGISPSNASFYNNEQLLYFLIPGQGLSNVTIGMVNQIFWYDIAIAINYGAQGGGCGVMFFVVLALSKAAKRKTPIFILNVLSLLLGFIRGILFAVFSLSPWIRFYPLFSNDFSDVPTSAYAYSISTSVIPLLMTTTVNLSLVFQAYTVTKNMQNFYRYAIISSSFAVFLLALAFQFALTITNSMAIADRKSYLAQWAYRGASYTLTISLWYFTLIFTSKLIYTLYYRRKHGWKQWSGVKILVAMGGCTMILPSLFTILEYLKVTWHAFPEAGTISLTLVALLLPLSSLWASMSIHNESSRFDAHHLAVGTPQSSSIPSSYRNIRQKSTMTSTLRTDSTGTGNEKGETDFEHLSPTTLSNKIEAGSVRRDSTEMDLESMGVRIDKSYSLQSTNGAGACK